MIEDAADTENVRFQCGLDRDGVLNLADTVCGLILVEEEWVNEARCPTKLTREALVSDETSDTQVGQAHFTAAFHIVRRFQKDILRLNVPVYYALGMHICQTLQELLHNGLDFVLWERCLIRDVYILKCAQVGVGHHDLNLQLRVVNLDQPNYIPTPSHFSEEIDLVLYLPVLVAVGCTLVVILFHA